MRFKIYREYGALNSVPVFDAVEAGLRRLGHEIVNNDEDIPVIWSVLWSGRMLGNKKIYDSAKASGKSVMIIEVGNFCRGKFWRISLNNINGHGFFGNTQNLDMDRPSKLGIICHPLKNKRNAEILIAAQHDKSLQWEGQPPLNRWVDLTVQKIRQFSDRSIVVRPHPRCKFSVNSPRVRLEIPKKIPNTYDDFDIDYDFHCVVNHNSGPAIQAALQGTPIICHPSSLAYPVSDSIENIEKISLKDRQNWLVELSHTEWSIDEIKTGVPFNRLLNNL